MKGWIKKLAKTLLYRGYFLYASVAVRCSYSHSYRHGELKYLSKEDYQIWRRAMLDLMKQQCMHNYDLTSRIVYQSFATAKIETVRVTPAEGLTTPIVVLCVKDDRLRLQLLVEHYRALGVERFAFIDNGSTDGTWEWLLEQEDIDLFRTQELYNCYAKEGWLNRVVSHYGFHRWYLLTDSDELMTYVGMEEHPIRELVEWAEANGHSRLKGLTLDMYADSPLYSIRSEDVDIRQVYSWMDTDSYLQEERNIAGTKISVLVGGPRHRAMGVNCYLMKHPLVYFHPGTISASAHYQYPYDLIGDAPCCVGILHYKFLDIDKKENERRAKLYAEFNTGLNKSANHYNEYVEASREGLSFMYEGSTRFTSSQSLRKIPQIRQIPFGPKDS